MIIHRTCNDILLFKQEEEGGHAKKKEGMRALVSERCEKRDSKDSGRRNSSAPELSLLKDLLGLSFQVQGLGRAQDSGFRKGSGGFRVQGSGFGGSGFLPRGRTRTLPQMRRVQGSGFRFWVRVLGFGFRVQGFGFRISGLGFRYRISGSGFRVSGFGFRVSGSGFRVQGFGFRVSGFGFWVSGSKFRVQGFGFRV